jgi:hypothetical protein
MNIAEILKNCPKGTKLYSPLYGEVELYKVEELDGVEYPIVCVITTDGGLEFFASDGRYYPNYPDSECMLFPSRDQRDWRKFIVPDQVNDQETKHQFKPFDKVLVRYGDGYVWQCNFFSSMDEDDYYVCVSSYWHQCIPFEGNEHLLGTTNDPEQ